MRMCEIEAVLLDMDGTLVDSDRAVERAWSTWAAERHVDARAILAIAHGRPAESTVRDIWPHLDDAAVRIAAQRQLDLQYGDLSDVVAMPGADLLLSTLRQLGLAWAVVTSADFRLASVRLAAAGIAPTILVTSDDVSEGKPAPHGYVRAAQQLRVVPERCLVVEDSAAGLRAGRRAGAMTAALRNLDGDLVITNLGQLSDMLTLARETPCSTR